MTYAIVVLYNKLVENSITYKYLKKYEDDIQIIIYDNGMEEYVKHNQKYCQEQQILFYTQNANVGISKAYNFAIDKISLSDENYIFIFDDDTILNEEYMKEAFKLIKEKKYDVILPIIVSNNKIISPANVQFECRIKILNKIEELKQDKISAINSGMIVKTSVYKKVQYNEKIFLDYVDHDFIKKIRNNNFNIFVMNTIIQQNYARFQKNSVGSEIFRFKIYLKDFKVYCKECNNLLFYYLSTFKYRIRECIRYKTLKFLFIK